MMQKSTGSPWMSGRARGRRTCCSSTANVTTLRRGLMRLAGIMSSAGRVKKNSCRSDSVGVRMRGEQTEDMNVPLRTNIRAMLGARTISLIGLPFGILWRESKLYEPGCDHGKCLVHCRGEMAVRNSRSRFGSKSARARHSSTPHKSRTLDE